VDLKISYEPKIFTAFQDSPYTGLPSPETDRAWHDLMANMSIRVSHQELAKANLTSTELPDGGYMAWLGVYHEMHCVVSLTDILPQIPSNLYDLQKMLRQWKYRDYYYPDIKLEDEAHRSLHAGKNL